MANSMDKVYRSQSLIYKYFLYFLTIGCIVFFFPKGGKFKYEFQKGKPWQYENLYAPFDFSIRKSDSEIEGEKELIRKNQVSYYTYDEQVAQASEEAYDAAFAEVFTRGEYSDSQLRVYNRIGREALQEINSAGIWPELEGADKGRDIYLVRDNEAVSVKTDELISAVDLDQLIGDKIRNKGLGRLGNDFKKVLLPILKPNIRYDAELSARELENELAKVSLTLGNINEGELIVAKGEVVEAENLTILNSLKSEYESELWAESNYYFILAGYTILVALVLMMLFLFIKRYRPEVFRNNVKVTFIFFNILLMVFITTFVVKYNDTYVFVVPLCILPLILKTFFDARLGLFVHVLTVLILGFVVPNSFEYIFLQIIAGIVTILTVSELYKRANLFISVGQITLIYIVGYFAFNVIQEGNLDNIIWLTFGFFLLNGMITLFAQPLIYIYEKIFGMVSDVSLLELSDTNSRLLKELANKAPGTFHHSLQVANLAEAAANEIGANAMLVRVGALYHDVGKMNRPTYFTENQVTNINPHDDLVPTESARIIINHVIEGIEIARKNNLPDRVIDFIRTHHGTNLVYYFYRKQQELEDEVDEELFRYPGPIPFSRETAILMMADSVEAASKSLKNPTYKIIDEFVDRIVGVQMNADQFVNANITFKEIEMVKKVLKHKLTNIYHLRVEYPE
ncbi:HD family phosphohydrolase [Lentiprolixibacter aurantiacus]|uniref:HDIG domain-containing protein n=1 Tax=Lentiprolixibacter aurantiacus TaxID=2993939 RepID=A0AAE3MM14_9FLAO|nr:HDIG domain-containing metalloprotein [Lentiprolixibacter aurantiacus]MCX2719929.1 HDIG domain-containing protein [Lentiprolixibacter aurantiacus]